MTKVEVVKKARAPRRSAARPIEVLVNPLAGSCGPSSADEMAELLESLGRPFRINPPGEDVGKTLMEMRARNPELMVVLAGDGTARAAASLCGPDGPLLAPLPGGTMNVLPKALYGTTDWQAALRATLSEGVERPVGGGAIGGHTFYVAAMLGSAAIFAPAREAVRRGQVVEAARKAKDAWNRAFTSRIRFALGSGREHKTLALALICPLISPAVDEGDRCLEAVAFDPSGPLEALRVGARVALSPIIGDWRVDDAVDAGSARSGWVAGRSAIPALLDGEPVRLGRRAEFSFKPKAFRAFAPPPTEDSIEDRPAAA